MRIAAVLVLFAACHTTSNATGDAAIGADANLLATTPNQWVWVPIAGTTCANGSVAGFGLNRSSTPGGDLFVYFEGGGACWDTASCTFQPPLAINLDVTYTAANLATDVTFLAVDRAAGAPLDTANYVFVPYCTGDLHSGTNVMAYPGGPTLHHTGGSNAQAFVNAIAGAFPTPQTIWVSGSSAGGYGATLDLHRFSAAWPSAGIQLLEDSSPFLEFNDGIYPTMQSSWKPEFPPNCTNCTNSFIAVFDTVVAAHPSSRIGLMTWDNDQTIAGYFGYQSLVSVQDDLITNHFNHANTHVFEATGTQHTMFGMLTTVTSNNVHLSDWVTQWLLGDAAWTTVRP